ncbi:MAG: histidine kinase [Bacteroidia bacterium]|nr:histidine kinase [Bacteroidia bacterium]
MSSSSVFSILEDKNGKMWFGTDNGLDCFAGNYREHYNNASGLSGSLITSITEYNNAIWAFSKRKGIFSIKQGKAKEIVSDTAKEYIGERLYIVDNNIVAINRGVHLVVYDNTTAIKKRTIIYGITDAFVDGKNNLIVLKGTKVYKLKGTSLVNLNIKGLAKKVYSYYAASENEFYLGGTSVVYRIVDLKVVDSIRVSANEFNIKGLCLDRHGNIWCSSLTSDDNYIITPLKKCVNIDSILGVKRLLITSIFRDSKKNIWLTTLNSGVYYFYNSFLEDLMDNYGSPAYVSRVINGNKGEVFLCTNFGLKQLDLTPNLSQQFKYFSKNTTTYIFDAAISEDNYLFVGNNSASGKVISNYGDVNFKDEKSTFFICSAVSNIYENKVAFGAWSRSVYIMEVGNKKEFIFKDSVELFSNNKRGVKTNRLFYDSKGTLWIGTSRGVGSYANGKLVKHDQKALDGEIYDIIEKKNGTLVFCSEFGIVEYESGKWKYNETHLGRKFTNVRTAVEDHKKRLWFAAPEGLFCLNDKGIIHLNIFDGIISKQINSMCYSREHNSIIIGTTSGVSVLNLSYFDKEFIGKRDIRISTISINNKNSEINDTLYLGTDERNLTIYLTSADLIHTNDIIYQYKIDSQNWVQIEGSSINFNNLPLPNATVSFRGSNDLINWSMPISLVVVPEPYFWETRWFKIGAGVLILSILVLIIFLNNKKNAEKLNYLNQLNELRYEALMASINPHFIFNALNSIQSFINDNDMRNGSDYLAKFAQLIRLTIDHADQRYILLSKELKRIEYYLQLEEMRFEGKFDFKIICNKVIDSTSVYIPNMIIQPFIENSIIHAFNQMDQKGSIVLRIDQKGDSIQIEIEDNGVGIDHSRKSTKSEHRSIGFSNVTARLKLLPGTTLEITDLSAMQRTGTLIRITTPLKNSQ